MRNIAYYHIYLTDDASWVYLFVDQFGELINSKLRYDLDVLNITAIGHESQFKHLHGLLEYYRTILKAEINVFPVLKNIADSSLIRLDHMHDPITETETLHRIWEDCLKSKGNNNILYFHSKGVTGIERCINIEHYSRFINTHHWRKHIEWSVFEKYPEAVEELKNYDVIGSNFSRWPTPHFSGNFWWSKTNYINTLPNPKDKDWWEGYKRLNPDFQWLPDRLVAEMWVCSNVNAKLFSWYNHPKPPPFSNLGDTILLEKDYK